MMNLKFKKLKQLDDIDQPHLKNVLYQRSF